MDGCNPIQTFFLIVFPDLETDHDHCCDSQCYVDLE